MNPVKTVGILGGMGPAATVDLMQRVIAATPAQDDSDHIRMLVDNNPKVPSRLKALIEKTGPSPLPILVSMAQQLVGQGAELLAMPCNTAHHYYGDLSAAVDVPFLNIMELVATRIESELTGARRVGLLASSALSQIQLYEPVMEARGIGIAYPNPRDQSALMELIMAIKGNRGEEHGYGALQSCGEFLKSSGVDCLIIACTELSVVSQYLDASLPTFDAADVLAREIVRRAT